jgi:hypothetical protein
MGKSLVLAFLGLLAIACSQEDLMRRIAPPAQQDFARAYIEQLRNRDFAAIEKALDPSIAQELPGGTLEKMAGLIPAGTPTSIKLVGANQFSSPQAGTTINLTFEYQFGNQFMLINVARKSQKDTETIVGFRVQPLSASLQTQNHFTLSGKSALQYGVLGAAIVATALTLFALVLCIRTKIAHRKWLWILFILAGFGKLAVNWTTGQWGITVLAVQLFSGSGYADFSGPWIISVSVPLGAAIFLSRRKQLTEVSAD